MSNKIRQKNTTKKYDFGVIKAMPEYDPEKYASLNNSGRKKHIGNSPTFSIYKKEICFLHF